MCEGVDDVVVVSVVKREMMVRAAGIADGGVDEG